MTLLLILVTVMSMCLTFNLYFYLFASLYKSFCVRVRIRWAGHLACVAELRTA